MPTTADPQALTAYEHIAPVYDQFTAHHDYELWLGNLLAAAAEHGHEGDSLLDVGCGTGASFLPMLDRGWRVVASDLSPAMAAQARAKANGRARVTVADLRDLPEFGRFDLVWCLDDAINYLANRTELAQALRGLAANLAPTGLLIFDVNTLLTYRTFFADVQEVAADGVIMRWQGESSSEFQAGSTAQATFTVTESGGQETSARHRQRHFTPTEIHEAMALAGLELVAGFGHGYDAVLEQPLDESVHTKAVYLSRRPR
ncbi:MAG: hypothetical protein QOI31_1699 [Solirubrobacterales bacterium]|jgi:SAM-dependent methyltransferase|nr:hypothetical protein [Solirubrobacterales bacterium]